MVTKRKKHIEVDENGFEINTTEDCWKDPVTNDKEPKKTKSKGKGHCEVDETGTKRWYFNGKLHRENGPAIIWSNGSKEWYLNGIYQDGKYAECEPCEARNKTSR